jgi:hypothetical protein
MKSFLEYREIMEGLTKDVDLDNLQEAAGKSDGDLISSVKRLSLNLVKLDPSNSVDSKSYYKLAKALNDDLTELLKRKA